MRNKFLVSAWEPSLNLFARASRSCPGKNIRWDPANPTWDPRCVPGGIPGGIMEHPAWDPTWDYGTSRMGSHMGSRQLKLGSHLKFLIASHLESTSHVRLKLESHQSLLRSCLKFQIVSHLANHIPGRIASGILPIPKISDGFPL